MTLIELSQSPPFKNEFPLRSLIFRDLLWFTAAYRINPRFTAVYRGKSEFLNSSLSDNFLKLISKEYIVHFRYITWHKKLLLEMCFDIGI